MLHIMMNEALKTVLSKDNLAEIFPSSRSNDFFEALFGDADEGSYDIELAYRELSGNTLIMELRLHERPNRCLACNLTQGLPQVFSRHPIINVQGIVKDLQKLLEKTCRLTSWSLGYTEQHKRSLHVIPLKIAVEKI